MITEEMLLTLREEISRRLSPRRFNHTLGVERAAEFLSRKCLPSKMMEIRAASLLHDITKELSYDEHIRLIKQGRISISKDELDSPALLHSQTAPIVIKFDFPEFATDEILSAVSKHTTGDSGMSVFDKIVFLADFIEDSRVYPESISTAKFVKENMNSLNIEENLLVLDQACVMEIDSAIAHLQRYGKKINFKTLEARASLISKN